MTRRAIPHLRASGNGSIINNLSLSVQTGGSGGGGPYAAAKGALQVMTRTLARELAPQVRVNAIMPGVIETQHHEIFSTPAKMEDYKKQTPLARNGHGRRGRPGGPVPGQRCVELHDRRHPRHQRRPLLAMTMR